MEVILLERVEKLGGIGDVVRVKDGYARNFLLPQKKAMRATEQNKTQFERRRAEIETSNAELRSEAEKDSAILDGTVSVLLRQASDAGHLYGSVTSRDIAAVASTAKAAVDRRQVMLGQPIKHLGVHPVRVFLHPEVPATVHVIVARSKEEAETRRQAFLRGDTAAVTPAEIAAVEEAEAKAEIAAEAEAFFDEDASPQTEDGTESEEVPAEDEGDT